MEVLTTLTASQITILTLAVVGVTELIARLRARDLWTALTIVSAGVVGALIAAYYVADPVGGLVLGFGASGAIKAVGSVGNKSTPARSSLTNKDDV